MGGGRWAVSLTAANTRLAARSVDPNRVKLCRLRLSIKLTDGSTIDVVSSDEWVAARGPITHVDIYDGEYVDMRQTVSDWAHPVAGSAETATPSRWSPVTLAGPPTPTTLVTSHAVLPKIGVRNSYSPCNLYESSAGVYVYDFCQNMAGIVEFFLPSGVAGPAMRGTNVTMVHAEAVHGPPPASINHHYRNTKEVLQITLAGDGAALRYMPKFTYMGFRYVEMRGYPGVPTYSTLTAHFLNTDYGRRKLPLTPSPFLPPFLPGEMTAPSDPPPPLPPRAHRRHLLLRPQPRRCPASHKDGGHVQLYVHPHRLPAARAPWVAWRRAALVAYECVQLRHGGRIHALRGAHRRCASRRRRVAGLCPLV